MSPTTKDNIKADPIVFRDANFNIFKVRIQAKLRSKNLCTIVNDIARDLSPTEVASLVKFMSCRSKMSEGFRSWSEKVICSQFFKENSGSLWASKFPNILIHKNNPLTMVISCYTLKTTFKLGGKDFQLPKYSRYGQNYFVTFTKVNNPAMARAVVKKLAEMTGSVVAAFNPTADQNVASPHLRVNFKASTPPLDDHDMEHESATEVISVGQVNVEPSQVDPSQTTNDVDMTASSSPNPSDTPDDAPLEEHLMTSQRSFQLVTGNRFGPAAKRPLSLSPRSAPLSTNNRYAILEEEDVELSMDDFVLPRIVLTDANFRRPTKVQGKKQRTNKSKHAHLERAQWAIRDKKVVRIIVECKSVLLQEHQIIAHSMFSSQNYEDPSQILAEIVPESHDVSVRLAVVAMDLFLENRAPDLYNNADALDSLLSKKATRCKASNQLTDWTILHVVATLHSTLESFKLPGPILTALKALVHITDSVEVESICDDATHSIHAANYSELLDLENDL
ncbi:hypothetical protein DYB32_008983 [Aphanomyces invadans]|uniref:Uncharacterized protein n=1 Tax=Aphanomyces invadans TaxID=157072 RepID=A0A418AJP3_9STRA|nr:hypothetical protein DYB32_008983 [Aphanomyces invadans]